MRGAFRVELGSKLRVKNAETRGFGTKCGHFGFETGILLISRPNPLNQTRFARFQKEPNKRCREHGRQGSCKKGMHQRSVIRMARNAIFDARLDTAPANSAMLPGLPRAPHLIIRVKTFAC
jgi:hypothetical protein